MTDFRYGPVELYLVGFEGERPDPATVSAMTDLVDGDFVRLLDVVILSKADDGELTVTEIDDVSEQYGFGDVELVAMGLAADEDVTEFAELIPPGGSAALIALELAFARTLAQRLDAAGGVVLRTERIPAPVVNAVVDALENEGA